MKNKKKIYKKLALLTGVGAVLGFLGGFAGAWIKDWYDGNWWDGLHEICEVAVPILHIVIMAVGLGYCFLNYRKAKKVFANWNQKDESVLDEIDKILEKALAPSNILLVCNFFLYSATISVADFGFSGEITSIVLLVLGIVVFVISILGLTILQKLVVDFTKRLNPEKRGDVLDTEFQKEWLQSCDEAEKKMIYEAGYKAYVAGTKACIVVWILTLFGILIFDTGLFPCICVCSIWFILALGYTMACRKLDRK